METIQSKICLLNCDRALFRLLNHGPSDKSKKRWKCEFGGIKVTGVFVLEQGPQ